MCYTNAVLDASAEKLAPRVTRHAWEKPQAVACGRLRSPNHVLHLITNGIVLNRDDKHMVISNGRVLHTPKNAV